MEAYNIFIHVLRVYKKGNYFSKRFFERLNYDMAQVGYEMNAEKEFWRLVLKSKFQKQFIVTSPDVEELLLYIVCTLERGVLKKFRSSTFFESHIEIFFTVLENGIADINHNFWHNFACEFNAILTSWINILQALNVPITER